MAIGLIRNISGGGGIPSSSNLKEIQKILDNHEEFTWLSVGQEVDITVDGSPWTMVIAHIDCYNDHDVVFVSKNLFEKGVYGNTTESNYIDTVFYQKIDVLDRMYIKSKTKQRKNWNTSTVVSWTAYTWVPNLIEAANSNPGGTYSTPIKQFDWFKVQSNRIKTYNGTATSWWTPDAGNSEANYIYTNGTNSTASPSSSFGYLPCFIMIADK